MRNSRIVAAVFVAACGAWLIGTAPALVGAAQDEEGYQPAGTWAWSTHRPSGGTFPALITYHRDGTITGSDGVMFGINFPPAVNPNMESGLHGVWERTGPHSFRGMSLYLQFTPDGNAIAWARARSELQFVGDEDHIEGTMYVDSLPCPTPFTCPDPTASAWTSTPMKRAVSAVRLSRVDPPGL